jgi:hypothetical protein
MTTPKIAVIDFAFLLLAKDLILVNECTILHYNTNITKTFHIRSGTKTLAYVKKNHSHQLAYNKSVFHGIPYDYGSITFGELSQRLSFDLSQFDVVLVKGSQKVTLVKRILGSGSDVLVCDLGVLDCPSVATLISHDKRLRQTSCNFHSSKFRNCTAFKIRAFEFWMQRNFTPTIIHREVCKLLHV